MKPEHCPTCQGRDLYQTVMPIDLKHGLFGGVPVQCSVCLSCGSISPYIAPGDLARVREWKAKAQSSQATVDTR
jgi:hypothetical protein